MKRVWWMLSACAVVLLLAVACSDDAQAPPGAVAGRSDAPRGQKAGGTGAAQKGRGQPDPLPAKPRLGKVRIALQPVADLVEPTSMAVRAGDDALYVTERRGRVRAIRGGEVTTLLDWRKETQHGHERGMLGLTFSPDGTKLYVYYIDNKKKDSHLDEYQMTDDGLDLASRREVLFVDQPRTTVHKGGQLAFGDDGMLYLSLGDGGPADEPPNTSQEMDTLLGKVVRIDPRPDGDRPYTIPADNPFVGRQGARGEIYALGLRNPWRFSFDRDTGDVWLTDVGRYITEEINVRRPGEFGGSNFGWPVFEGSTEVDGGNVENHVEPFYSYPHDNRCAVVGGYVYRGAAIPDLRGAYVYGDYCEGEVRALVRKKKRVTQNESLGASTVEMSSFGQDHDGELYVLSLREGLSKIVPAD